MLNARFVHPAQLWKSSRRRRSRRPRMTSVEAVLLLLLHAISSVPHNRRPAPWRPSAGALAVIGNLVTTSDDGPDNAEEAVGEDGECIDDGGVDVEEESNVDEEDCNMVLEGMDRDDDDGAMLLEACHHFVDDGEDASSSPLESLGLNIINWYLVESCGKLLMVKPQLQCPKGHVEFTRKVEVFELDMSAGAVVRVPVVGEIGGRSLFISRSFCKSVRAGGEIEAGAIYFIDSGGVFSMLSKTRRDAQ